MGRERRFENEVLMFDSQIGLGFSAAKVPLNRLPGWEQDSWAYHGDDGYSFCQTASGKAYAQKFGFSDVIGCGVNFKTRCAFYTKNGHYLGKFVAQFAFRPFAQSCTRHCISGHRHRERVVPINWHEEAR